MTKKGLFAVSLRCLLHVTLFWMLLVIIFAGCVLYKRKLTPKVVQVKRENAIRRIHYKNPLQEEDTLWPLKRMFDKAGEEETERESTSVELPLTDLEEEGIKPEVLLLVIIFSAPQKIDRRMALRQTWWRKCTRKVSFTFYSGNTWRVPRFNRE